MKRCSTSLIFKEMQNKTIARYNLIRNTMMKIWVTDNTKGWWDVGKLELSSLLLRAPVGTTTSEYWHYLSKWNTHILCDPAILQQDIEPRDMDTHIQQKAYKNGYRSTTHHSRVPEIDVNTAPLAYVLCTSFSLPTAGWKREWNSPRPKRVCDQGISELPGL